MTEEAKVVRSSKRKKVAGRVKGTPNKATKAAREAIAEFVEGNAHRLQGWLDEIAAEEGARTAMECFKDLIEYHIPKQARMTVDGELAIKGSLIISD